MFIYREEIYKPDTPKKAHCRHYYCQTPQRPDRPPARDILTKKEWSFRNLEKDIELEQDNSMSEGSAGVTF